MFDISTLHAENYNLRNALTYDVLCNDTIYKPKTPCRIDKRTLEPVIIAYKSKSNEWFKNTLVIDDSCGYGIKCGRQMNGKYIICLDFDIYIKETDSDCKICKKYLDDYNDVCGSEDGMYESSTEGNWNVLCDITECTDLINLCEQQGKETFKPIPNCGLEFQITKNQVIPPTATPCKKTGNADKRREFSNNAYPFKIVQMEDSVHQYLGRLLTMTQNKPYIEGSETTENKEDTVIRQYTDMLMNGLNFHMSDFNDYLRIREVLKTNGFSKELFNDWVATTNPKDETHLQLWDAPCKYKNMNIGVLNNLCKKLNPIFYKSWKVKVADKKPKKSYKEQYSEIMENSKKEEDLFDCTVADDDHASSLIYKSVKNKLVFCKAQLYYKTDMSLWITDTKIIKSLICVRVADAHFTKLTANGSEITFSGNLCNQRNVADCVINLAIQKRDDTWIDKWNSSSVGKMLFNNGYYDFVEKTFITRDCEDFDETIIFNNITGYDFEMCIDTEYLAKIQKAVFTDALGDEVGDFMKQKIARALSGEIMKEASCIFGIGSGNAGKSFIGRILKKCAGSYVGNFNGNNLSHKKNENNDEAQALRWVKLLSDKRIIISQELGQNNKLNGEIIKKLTGGDVLTARGHGENETDFYFQGLVLAYCNDTPNIMPYDDACAFRTRVAEYNNSFVANPNPNDIFQKQLDMTLDAESQTEKFACAFMTLLFQSYHAERVNSKIESMIATAKQQFEGEDGNIMDTLLGNYKFTGDSEHSVSSADIAELFKKTSFSMNKIATEIKKYCICNNIEGVCSKSKKIARKVTQCWVGIAYLDDNQSYEEENV